MINSYFKKLSTSLDNINQEDLYDIVDLIKKTTTTENNIFIFGNGGSSSTASHFAQDMNKMLSCRFISLNDNTPSLLAYANDIGFESIFELQLTKLIKKNDLVIGISGSGNSKNVINAITFAKNFGCQTIGFTGFDGGKVKQIVDKSLHIPCDDMQICEDCHMISTHLILKIMMNENE